MARPLTYPQILEMAARLPSDRPYTASEADDCGVGSNHRRVLVRHHLVSSRMKGVFHAAALPDSLDLRVSMLRLVVPADCVVTDRSAAWLWGAAMALAPGDHRAVPKVSVFAPPGRRLRNELTSSGERRLGRDDVVELGGLRVTTPLRTACDVLRLLDRDQALAAADALASLRQFTVEDLSGELVRFRGYRHVIQARTLAPLVDARSESAMESISRLRWYDAGLPAPECQVVEHKPDGSWFAIDIGLPEERFGLEYFGEEWHGEGERDDDEARLAWLRDERRWTLLVARRENVLGQHQDVIPTLRGMWELHRARSGRPAA